MKVKCRTPFPERLFRLENNSLILIGRESIGSCFEQALLARRQQHLIYSAECQLQFAPQTYQQAAGLITYYNGHKLRHSAVSVIRDPIMTERPQPKTAEEMQKMRRSRNLALLGGIVLLVVLFYALTIVRVGSGA